MMKEIELKERQIEEIKSLSLETRKRLGVSFDVPLGGDMVYLLEKEGIVLCEYPFQTTEDSHTDAAITRFETKEEPMVFIGLNTSLYYDEQIFALAHELYHYYTKTGKAYVTEMEQEDPITERKADRYAAELLMPSMVLTSRVRLEFPEGTINQAERTRLLRFIARLQCEWWLPYRSIVLRLMEEGLIEDSIFELLYKIDPRNEQSDYARILKGLSPEQYEQFNRRTKVTRISGNALEIIIKNYEDGDISEQEFARCLNIVGKNPTEFIFDTVEDEDEDLAMLLEGGEPDES